MRFRPSTPLILFCLLLSLASVNAVAAGDELTFDDKPLDERISYPDWFKLSFLELHDDLQDAIADGKRGLIIYFGQQDCPYCQAHLKNSWGRDDIVRYTRKHFDVIAIDVRGDRPVTDLDGIINSEKKFSALHKTNFTPSFLFIDETGKVALKLSGYHPPYQFQAALEFVADQHYKKEGFRQYLARADAAFAHGNEGLNQDDAFSQPPFALDRTRFAASTPLLVMFEQSKCHACDVLHAGPLQDRAIRKKMKKLELVQLDMWSDTAILTPDGQRTTARDWAQKLGIYYTPTMVFFDEHGKEIIRVDSVVGFYRLNNVLEYILSGGYRNYPTFQRWRREFKKEDAPRD